MANFAISCDGNAQWMPKLRMHLNTLECVTCEAVSEQLGLKITRLPSDTTFRRILQKLDFQLLAQQFGQWASQTIDIQPQEWIAIDGKSIKGTVTESSTAYQNFVSLVSLYSSVQGVVFSSQQFESKLNCELKVVLTILESLQLQAVVFTMDALHCQKNYSVNHREQQ